MYNSGLVSSPERRAVATPDARERRRNRAEIRLATRGAPRCKAVHQSISVFVWSGLLRHLCGHPYCNDGRLASLISGSPAGRRPPHALRDRVIRQPGWRVASGRSQSDGVVRSRRRPDACGRGAPRSASVRPGVRSDRGSDRRRWSEGGWRGHRLAELKSSRRDVCYPGDPELRSEPPVLWDERAFSRSRARAGLAQAARAEGR